MKKLLFILSVFCFTAINGQNVLTLTLGSTIYQVGGNYPNGQPQTPILTLENMDLISNGNTNQFGFRFSGNANSTVSGNGGPDGIYYNVFDIAKTGGAKLILLQNPRVFGQVIFTSGYLDLNGNVLSLFTHGELFGESENSRIIGPSGGYVQYKQHYSSTRPGWSTGITYGYVDDVHSSWIRRGHVSFTGNLGTGFGIQRYFQIVAVVPLPGVPPSISVRMKYLESELNDLNENDLVFWSSPDMVNWTNNGYTTRNTTDNYLELSNITNFQDKYFTLAPAGSPRSVTSAPQQIKTIAVPGKETITNKWNTWPNPAGKILSIDITSTSASQATTSIFDSNGSLIQTQTNHLTVGSNRLRMDLKNLAAGIYYITTTWNAGKENRSTNFVKL